MFGAPAGGRSGVMGGNFVSGSLASYVGVTRGLTSGIGRIARCSVSFPGGTSPLRRFAREPALLSGAEPALRLSLISVISAM